MQRKQHDDGIGWQRVELEALEADDRTRSSRKSSPAMTPAGSIPPIQDDGQSPSSAGDTPSQHSMSDDDESEVEDLRQIVACNKAATQLINRVANMLASLDDPTCCKARGLLEKSLAEYISAMFTASWGQFEDDVCDAVLRELRADATGGASTSSVKDSPSSPLSAQHARTLEIILSDRSGSTQADEDGTLDAEYDPSMMLSYSPSSEIILSGRSGSTQVDEDGTSDAENDPSMMLSYSPSRNNDDGCVGGNDTDAKTSSAVTIQCAARRYLAVKVAALKASGSDVDTGVDTDNTTVADCNEAALNPHEVELAIAREKIRALEERLRVAAERGDEVAALGSAAADDDAHVVTISNLRRNKVYPGPVKKPCMVPFYSMADAWALGILSRAMSWSHPDTGRKATFAEKVFQSNVVFFLALGFVYNIYNMDGGLDPAAVDDDTGITVQNDVEHNVEVLVDAMGRSNIPLGAFDSTEELKKKAKEHLTSKAKIKNLKAAGQNLWTMAPPDKQHNLHAEQYQIYCEIFVPFHDAQSWKGRAETMET